MNSPEGIFDPEQLVTDADFGKIEGDNTVIRITDNLDDILNNHECFDAKRSLLRSAFCAGTFRAATTPDDTRFSYAARPKRPLAEQQKTAQRAQSRHSQS